MPYATAQDMIDRFDDLSLKQVTDPDAQTINTVKLDRAVADASDEIDGYLEARYKLPFDHPPKSLRILCCNIAMYQLLVLRPVQDMEDARKRYEDAIKFLTSVAKGDIQLGLSDDDTPATHTAGPVVEGPKRVFDRHTLKGF